VSSTPATAHREEHVLVVPRARLEHVGMFQGFCGTPDRYVADLLDPAHTFYRPRSTVEEDPSLKQLIPYCVLRWFAPDGAVRLFAYTRGGGGGEARLRAKRSVGIGGHISDGDGLAGDAASYAAGMRRELGEEVVIDAPSTERCVGLINDDSTPVGSVHLGIVHLVDLERPDVAARESDIADHGFETLAALLADRDRFETWSQMVLDAAAAGLLPDAAGR
jgi:predicted NUDIX family phosphoesterase